VVDAKTRFDDLDLAHVGIVAPGVDVDLVTEPRERARELANVDVHTPAVARAGLGEGRGVIGENTESSHAPTLPGELLNK
jgi:hypothetical protein